MRMSASNQSMFEKYNPGMIPPFDTKCTIFNAKFIIFNQKFIISTAESIIFEAKFIMFNTKFIIFKCLWWNHLARGGNQLTRYIAAESLHLIIIFNGRIFIYKLQLLSFISKNLQFLHSN